MCVGVSYSTVCVCHTSVHVSYSIVCSSHCCHTSAYASCSTVRSSYFDHTSVHASCSTMRSSHCSHTSVKCVIIHRAFHHTPVYACHASSVRSRSRASCLDPVRFVDYSEGNRFKESVWSQKQGDCSAKSCFFVVSTLPLPLPYRTIAPW